MNIFDFSEYKAYVKERLKAYPSGGRGQLKAMATALRLQPSSLSLVFSGDRELSPEQACGVAAFLQLDEVETEYFLTIVELAKASTKELIRVLEFRLKRVKEDRHRKLAAEFGQKQVESGAAVELSLTDRIEFYSDWYHMAILLLMESQDFRTPTKIAKALSLPTERVTESLEFLLRIKACARDGSGLKPLILRTVLRQNDSTSFMYYKGWRQNAVNRYHSGALLEPHECGATTVFHASKDVMFKMRELMLTAFQKTFAEIQDSPAEIVGYLNLDLHAISKGPSS